MATQTSPQTTTSSVPTTLAGLESFFQSQIQSTGQVAVTQANVGIAGLTSLLNETIGPNLVITSPVLTLSSSTLTVTGTLNFLSTAFTVTLSFTEANGSFSLAFTGTQAANTSISLTSLVAEVLPAATNAPSVNLSGLQITFATSPVTYNLTGTASWQIPLGTQQSTIQVTLTIEQSGATLSGSLAIGASTFSVTYTLQSGGQVLTGAWSTTSQGPNAVPLGWTTVVGELGLTAPSNLPTGLAIPGFTAAQLSIDFSTDNLTLSGQTANGAAFFEASKQSGSWGFAFGAAVAAGWTFGEISSDLSVMDFLVFQDAYLLISTFTQKQYTFPNFALMTTPINVVPGLNLGGVINFAAGTSTLAKNAYSLVGTSTASMQGSIGTLANTQISASLGGSMIIPPAKNLVLANPQFIVIASPLTVEIQGTLQVALSSQTVDITGRLGISAEEADFTVDVAGKSLTGPFGFTGVTLQQIGASIGIGFTPPSLAFAMEAIFQVGHASADKCAIDFEVDPDAVNPVLLWGQFSSISFPLIFNAVCPRIVLPQLLGEVNLQNAYLYYCEQPTVLPDNTSAAPGFAISGTLNAFHFTMAAALQINFTSGISGSAAMTPIHLVNNTISITGNGSLGGPGVAFNTITSPFLAVTLDVQLMGIVGTQINGTVTSTGFTFYLLFTIPSVQLSETLTCTFLNYTNFKASTALQFNLNFSVGPLKPPQTNINLGTIRVNTSFSGSLSLGINSTAATGSVAGTFDGRTLPSYSFDASTVQLQQLPKLIENAIQSEATTIYADVLSNASEWASMVKSGVITGADDAAKVLTGFFGQTASVAQALLQQYGLHGSTTVHEDVNLPHVDVPAAHVDVPSTHSDSNPHADVPATHIDTSALHADIPAGHSDFSLPHVDTHDDVGFLHINSHDDTGGHTDSQLYPHGDTGGHTDSQTTPHGDSSSHVDTQLTPHGDTPTPHGDTTPHTDLAQHLDV